MNDYLYRLVLSYLYQKGKKYDLSELRKLIGKDPEELDLILMDMLEKDYIKYDDYELIVTSKGEIFLVNNECYDYTFEEQSIQSQNIEPAMAIPINEPYIPKKFLSKI